MKSGDLNCISNVEDTAEDDHGNPTSYTVGDWRSNHGTKEGADRQETHNKTFADIGEFITGWIRGVALSKSTKIVLEFEISDFTL